MRLPFFHCVLLLVLLAIPVWAHPNLQDAMWVQFEPERIRVAVNVSLKEISVAHGLAVSESGDVDGETLAAAVEKHREYVRQHLRLSAGGQDLTGRTVKVTPPPLFSEPEKTFYQYELEYPLSGPPPAEVAFYHDMLKEWPYAVGTAWDVNYVVRVKRAGSNEVTSWLLQNQKTAKFPTGGETVPTPSSQVAQTQGWRTFWEYLQHGAMHILTGYDHLLFVSALVIATLSFWEMVKVIAAFTLAHTITLALSVFDIFRLSPSIVEPIIALSIVFVALENIVWPRRAHSRVRLAVAFGFGLVHGLGFAGGLLEAMEGLPAVGIWIALAAFSIGVEIGHQIVVLPLFGLLALGRRQLREGFHTPALRFGSAAISLCGAYYLVVAVHEQFFAR